MSQLYEYRTVKRTATIEIVEKKSKFIANVKSVSTEDEAVDFINEIKSKHPDARHNVFAYYIDERTQRYSDDGEPSGTAGVPALEIIKKEELINVVVVITRYFGGILLGAGGLTRAYAKATKEGIHAANIITKKLNNIIKIYCDYIFYGKIKNRIQSEDCIIEDIKYGERVLLTILCDLHKTETLIKQITDISNGDVLPEIIGNKYVEVSKGDK